MAASFFGGGPLPDWKDIKKWLGDDIPWEVAEKWDQAGNGDWLDRFIGNMLKDNAPGRNEERKPEPPVGADTAKYPKKVTVTVRIPPDAELRDLRLYATSDRLKVEGLPGGRSRVVRFPCRVFPRSGKATFRDGRLRVQFRRRPETEEDVELFLRP